MDNINLESKLTQLDDIMVHVGFVMKAGHKLSRKLMLSGEEDKAIGLLQRILMHDFSKSLVDEFYGMAKFSEDMASMKDPNVKRVADGKMDAIKLHWSRNDHHPEFWTAVMPNTLTNSEPIEISSEMSELSIAEMCCDWYARSMQFNSNVLDFYKIMSKDRWKFTKEQDELIVKFLSMLQE